MKCSQICLIERECHLVNSTDDDKWLYSVEPTRLHLTESLQNGTPISDFDIDI